MHRTYLSKGDVRPSRLAGCILQDVAFFMFDPCACLPVLLCLPCSRRLAGEPSWFNLSRLFLHLILSPGCLSQLQCPSVRSSNLLCANPGGPHFAQLHDFRYVEVADGRTS